MKNILVTGGAGFIGSNFIKYFLNCNSSVFVVNLDLLTYAGNLENLTDLQRNPRYAFIRGDIRDKGLVESLFSQYDIDTVIHFAAESHVDRSIDAPEAFLSVNVLGTQTLLEAAKKAWNLSPMDKYCMDYREGVRFLQVSTDEVYGSLGKFGKFSESSCIMPNSPYSASKASADLIVRAYFETYKLPVNITRCSNNYGPYQFPEKLIPLMIHNCMCGRPLPVYGDGLQVRDWLHVTDHCSAILAVLEKGEPGEVYNIGGDSERTNLDIINLILNRMGREPDCINHVKDRPGHDRRYAMDHTKITSQLGWHPVYTFEAGMEETIAWYLSNQDWINHIVSGDYAAYYETMYQLT